MSYKALDVAKYVIEYTNDIEKPISNLKLQKLLYYIQAKFLVGGKELFEDEIVHWNYGPVVTNVYKELKFYGSNNLKYNTLGSFLDFNDYIEIEEVDKLKINKILKLYLDLSASELVTKTHEEDPWKNTNYNQTISKKSIKTFFE